MPRLTIELQLLDLPEDQQRVRFDATSDEKSLLLGSALSWMLGQIARICVGGPAAALAAPVAPLRPADDAIPRVVEDARLLVGHGANVEQVADATGVPADELRPFAGPNLRDTGPAAAMPPPAAPQRVPASGQEARRQAAERAVLAACTTDGRLLADVRGAALAACAGTVGGVQAAIDRLEEAGMVRRFGHKHARMIHLLDATERLQARPPAEPEPRVETPAERQAAAAERCRRLETELFERRARIRQVLKPLLDTGRLFALSNLVTEAREAGAVEDLEIDEVRVIMTDWARAGQVGVSTIGLERRYRKRGDVEAVAL